MSNAITQMSESKAILLTCKDACPKIINMSLRGVTKDFILPLLIGVLSNALYHWLIRGECQRLIGINYQRLCKLCTRAVYCGRLLAWEFAGVLRRFGSGIHTNVFAVGQLILIRTKAYAVLPGSVTSYISCHVRLTNLRTSEILQNPNALARNYLVRLAGVVTALFLAVGGAILVGPDGYRDDVVLQSFDNLGLAEHTKEQLLEIVGTRNDRSSLEVSYWLRGNGVLYQLDNTTHSPVRMSFPANSESVVGCADAHPNQFVSWSRGKEMQISSLTQQPSFQPKCVVFEEASRRLESIFCHSFSATSDGANAVAICVYSEHSQDILSERSINLVRSRAKEFYSLASRFRIEPNLSRRIARNNQMPRRDDEEFLPSSVSLLRSVRGREELISNLD